MDWYLLRSKPRDEDRATENIKNQDMKAFCPKLAVEKSLRGRKRVHIEPMFKGYLFAQLTLEQGFHAIKNTRGVAGFVRYGGLPRPVASSIISEVILRCAEQGEKERQSFISMLPQKGQIVTLNNGPFANLDLIFQELSGETRAVLLLDMLNKYHRIEVDLRHVKIR